MTIENLVILIQEHSDNEQYLEQLYTKCLPDIKRIAAKYNYRDIFDDLCQEGFMAVWNAAMKYDPKQGASFKTYSEYWIRLFMIRYCERNNYYMRIPSWMFSQVWKYKTVISDYQKEHGADPDAEYVISVLHISKSQLDDIKSVISILESDTSLEQPIFDSEDGETVSDTIPDPCNEIDDLLGDIDRQDLKNLLWNIVDHLKSKESKVIHMRYQEGKTLKECSKELQISPERCRQYEHSGIRNLKYKKRELMPYYDEFVYGQGLKHTSFSAFRYSNESSVERAVRILDEMDSKK